MRKNSLTFVFLGSLAVALLVQCPSGMADVEKLYRENCAGCHGNDLAGGSGSSLIDEEWTYGSGDADIAAVIRNGVPDVDMPAWDGALDDDQIRSMVIYIREMGDASREAALSDRLEAKEGVYEAAGYRYRVETIAEGDDILWSMDFLPDGDILVTQRNGELWRINDGERVKISGTPEVWQKGQGGLLEVQLHPDYEQNDWIYLSFSENTGATENGREAGMTAIVRGRIENGKWTDEEKIFEVDGRHHTSSGVHFGSRFVFDGGYLFFSIGDRGRQDRAQDLDRPNGKIFRIYDDGRIPVDNPFVGVDDALPAIWSYGHRNPQGMDLDPLTGLLWEAEHGPRGGDEINLVEKGKNYGWPVITYGMNYNGTPITDETSREGMEQPKWYWVPSIAVAGIDFYQGAAFPAWTGKLLAGGMASEELHLLTVENGTVTKDEVIFKGRGRVRDVSSGPDGFIYLLLSDGSPRKGRVVRLVPAD
jgi:glucose/arabinose dehydrogenase